MCWWYPLDWPLGTVNIFHQISYATRICLPTHNSQPLSRFYPLSAVRPSIQAEKRSTLSSTCFLQDALGGNFPKNTVIGIRYIHDSSAGARQGWWIAFFGSFKNKRLSAYGLYFWTPRLCEHINRRAALAKKGAPITRQIAWRTDYKDTSHSRWHSRSRCFLAFSGKCQRLSRGTETSCRNNASSKNPCGDGQRIQRYTGTPSGIWQTLHSCRTAKRKHTETLAIW